LRSARLYVCPLARLNKSSAVAEMGDRLATIDAGRKLGAALPWGSWAPSNNVAWAEAYLCTKWHPDPSSRLATVHMGRKFGTVPLSGEAGSPCNTMSHVPRPISL